MEEQELESGKIRKFIYVNRKAPHGTIYAHEALEVVLIAAAFEQDVSLAFIDDGVYQLKKGQNTDGIATKNFSKTFGAPKVLLKFLVAIPSVFCPFFN